MVKVWEFYCKYGSEYWWEVEGDRVVRVDRVKELMAIRYLKRNPKSNSIYSKKMKRILSRSVLTAQDILRQIAELK